MSDSGLSTVLFSSPSKVLSEAQMIEYDHVRALLSLKTHPNAHYWFVNAQSRFEYKYYAGESIALNVDISGVKGLL